QTEVLQLLLPVLRADFEAIASYQYAGQKPALDCPIVAFGGSDDLRVSQERLEGWIVLTSARFAAQYFPGDHFFINHARGSIVAAISSELISSHAKN
ncbi:MAG TPA: thioesterase domain-containing protein, partial [Anaerolineales bacterium]|nr:thioesterase domain-containing protein [Anaerolineales bacterium]